MMSKFELRVVKERNSQPKTVRLGDLSSTSCFYDQYENVMMVIEKGICSMTSGGKCDLDLGHVTCVCLSGSPKLVKGGTIRYSSEDNVVPLYTTLTVRKE